MATPTPQSPIELADRASAFAAEYLEAQAAIPWDARQALALPNFSEVDELRATIAGTQDRVHEILSDVTLYPEGRKVLAEQAREAAREKVSALLERADAKLEVAKATLILAALPKLPHSDKLSARHDAELVMNAASNKRDAFLRLAQRQDSVGALLNTAYADMLLMAHGIQGKEAQELRDTARTLALKAASEQKVDVTRAASARAYFALRKVENAFIGLRTAANLALGKHEDGRYIGANSDERN